MKWKIYYGDGTTFGSQDGLPQDAPGLDVQVIVMESKNHGWMTQAGDHYYIWDCRGGETRWWGVDRFGLDEYLFYSSGFKVAKSGRKLSTEQFSKIFRRASNDPDFPAKTSFALRERKP